MAIHVGSVEDKHRQIKMFSLYKLKYLDEAIQIVQIQTRIQQFPRKSVKHIGIPVHLH